MNSSTTTADNFTLQADVVQNSTAGNIIYNNLYWGAEPAFKNYSPGMLTGEPNSIFETVISDNDIIELEKSNYEQKKDEYLPDYEGKYIALLNGKVIDSNSDFSELAKSVYDKIGYQSVFITLVKQEERKYKLSSPKFKK